MGITPQVKLRLERVWGGQQGNFHRCSTELGANETTFTWNVLTRHVRHGHVPASNLRVMSLEEQLVLTSIKGLGLYKSN